MAQVQVSGLVKDAETGLPLPGVNILIIGSTSRYRFRYGREI